MRESIGMVAGYVSLISFVPYISGIVRKKNTPSITTWGIWAVVDSIMLASMWLKGTVNMQIAFVVVGAWIVVFLVMFYGEWTLGWEDGLCVAGAIIGVTLAVVLKDPNVSIVATNAVVFAAGILTYKKTRKKPASESLTAWTLTSTASVLSCMAIPALTIGDVAQPATFVAVSLPMAILLWRAFLNPAPEEYSPYPERVSDSK